MSKKNDASGSSALRRSTSSLRPKRRIVTWKGSGVPSGGARSAIASPSRIVSRRGSRRVASTTSGTATVTSFSWREKTRTSSPALCTWIRAPSSLYSNAASPSSARASATSPAAWASIGWIGRNSSIRKRASPAAPSTSAARATAAKSPASIAARRTKPGSSPAARATASVTSPSSAPWRNSPINNRKRNSCSSWVARANSSRSSRSLVWAEPLPVVWARRREVWTRSSRRTGERCTPPLRTASAGRECPPRGDSALGSGCGFSRDQLLTQLPQPPPRRGIVRLRLGAPLLQPVEVASAHAVQLGRDHQPARCLEPVCNRAHRVPEGLAHHLGGHERRGMQGVDRDTGLAGGAQALRQLEGEHDLGQLALPVRREAVVAPLEHHVVEVDGCLSHRRHVHDPCGRRAPQQRQKQVREQERRQVVDRETELVSVGARLAPAMTPTTADPGVVHEHVEPRLVALDLAGETAHRLERREVGPVDAQPVVVRSLADLLGRARQPVRAAAVEQHGRTARGQVLRQRPAEPVGGAGDEDRLLVEGTHQPARARSLRMRSTHSSMLQQSM